MGTIQDGLGDVRGQVGKTEETGGISIGYTMIFGKIFDADGGIGFEGTTPAMRPDERLNQDGIWARMVPTDQLVTDHDSSIQPKLLELIGHTDSHRS